MPYYADSKPDPRGYVANPAGSAFVDKGVGGFLARERALSGDANPNPTWEPYAGKFMGRYQVPTLRNVDKRPYEGFVKAYMHNGYFTSLKDVMHFYNTRDVLPRCGPNDPGEKSRAGLHLKSREENSASSAIPKNARRRAIFC
jgi:cytochrome c peroxidase